MLPGGVQAVHHTHDAVYNAEHPEETSCEEVAGCHEVVNVCDVDSCRVIGGPVHHCTWNAEGLRFDCFHVKLRVHP
jgi:hypothetical protein